MSLTGRVVATLQSMRRDGQRVDAQDNRNRLLAAVGRLLTRNGTLTLTDLATEAGVSRSTTYRNFATPAAAIEAYVDEFLNEFEAAVADSAQTIDDPVHRLIDLCAAWGELVEERSPALVHVRSTEGFLTRVRRGDPVISRVHRLVRGVVDDAIADGSLPPVDPDYAVFLWNLLLDPRELLDLAEHTDQTVSEVTRLLTADYLQLLRHTRSGA